MSLQSERKRMETQGFSRSDREGLRGPALSSVLPPSISIPVPLLSLLVLRISGCNKRQCKVDFGADSATVQPCSFTSSPMASCNPFLFTSPLLVPAAATSVLRLRAVPHPLRLWHYIEIPEGPARSRDQAKMVGGSSKTMQLSFPSLAKEDRKSLRLVATDSEQLIRV